MLLIEQRYRPFRTVCIYRFLGGKMRRFNASWLKDNKWMRYSVKMLCIMFIFNVTVLCDSSLYFGMMLSVQLIVPR